MIVSIKSKSLKLLWQKNDPSKISASHLAKVRLIMDMLNSAEFIDDMNFEGSKLHKLKGELKQFWSVKVNANYRIIFRFDKGNTYDIDYIDYH
jgi:toxin HigB-1